MHHVLKPLLLAALVLPALAGTAAAQQTGAPTAASIDPKWMITDSAAKKVTVALTAGLTAYNGALNFNGFRDGELTFIVPAGWTVVVNFTNHDGMLSHSAEVIDGNGPLPIKAVEPAIQRAYTKDLETGVQFGGGKDVIRFTATPPGDYRFFCAVPGHGAAGMWVRLKVDAGATMPSMAYTPKPAAPAAR